ncbi:MAG: YceI family protein [Planctomycetia bacterium]|nr:YceI family protein [Planctomycetia bacterium]
MNRFVSLVARQLPALAGIVLSAASSFAQQSALQPGQVDVQRSKAYAFVAARGLGHEHGVEGRVASGTIRLGVAQQAGELTFDLKSFVCDTADSRGYVGVKGTTDESTQQQTTANMISAAVLDVAKFPTATYLIRSSLPLAKQQPNDPDRFELSGDFTLHGVTRPLSIRVIAEPAPGLIRLRGHFSVKQRDFGMTPFSKAFGAIGVADEVKIWGDVSIAAQ